MHKIKWIQICFTGRTQKFPSLATVYLWTTIKMLLHRVGFVTR